MKISRETPPIFEVLQKQFGVSWDSVVITYGDTVYCKDGELSPDLVEHEGVHVKQQAEMGVEKWWRMYLDDPRFRFSQELEAYRAQYKCLGKIIKDRNRLAIRLSRLASDLSGSMYGRVCTHQEATQKIRS